MRGVPAHADVVANGNGEVNELARVVVRFNFPGYATAPGVEPNAATPHGFVVPPRTDKPIVLEQDDARHKAVTRTPPEWQEAAAAPPTRADGRGPRPDSLRLARFVLPAISHPLGRRRGFAGAPSVRPAENTARLVLLMRVQFVGR